jgi:alpha-galactosidase
LQGARISVVGAGSTNFSLELVKDICLTPSLAGSTISFMDIDQKRLDAVHTLASRYAKEMKIDLKLEKTTERRRSLQDADFVINLALVVGHKGYTKVWDMARKRGYRFGGSYHVMHDEGFWINFYQFRLFESIVEDVLEVCPNAWYIQLANPVLAATTYLRRKYPKLNFVGMCEGPRSIYTMSEVFGLDPGKISFEMPGVNHFVWLTRYYSDGEDALPVIDSWIRKNGKRYWRSQTPSTKLGPVALDLYDRFGVFPIGDTCTPGGGSWPWWYHEDTEKEKRWGEDPEWWWRRELGDLDSRGSELDKLLNLSAPISDVILPEKSRQFTVPFIESVMRDIPRVLPLNVLNTNGSLPGVPDNFDVEVPCLVTSHGVQGQRSSGLPSSLVGYILRDRVAPVETELEAYQKGDRDKLLELLMMDPWTKSEGQASGLMKDVFADRSFSEMAKHYT